MKITIKNIHQQTFTVEIDGSRKVSDLKTLLANNIPDYPASKQFIIYAGRIMEDDHLLGSYSFDSSRFLVVMNREPIQHQLNTTGPLVQSKSDQPTMEARKETPPIEEQCGAYSNEAAAANSAISPNDQDYIITGTEKYIEICKNLIDMGYPEKDVELAMNKAFNNPERAVEYLLHGCLQPSPPQPGPQPQRPTQSVPMQTNEQTAPPRPGPLDFLKSQTQFLQMRRVVRENPHLLSAVLKKIEDTNPSLLKLITDNKDEFLRIMNEENASSLVNYDVIMPSATQSEVQPHSQPPNQPPANPAPVQSARTTITVTSQEKEAIERLKTLGFTEHMVLQAYFACDKNELQAADFLLSQDDDAERPGDG